MNSIGPWCLVALAMGFVVPASSAATLVRGPYLQNASPTAITIRWRTDTATDSRVWAGPAPGGNFLLGVSPALTTEHEVRLQGLAAGATHFYAVGSTAGPLPGADATWNFVLPPGAGTRRATRAWVLGDPGAPTDGQGRVRDAYLAWTGERDTDVWLMLGDLAYDSGTDSEFQSAIFEPFEEFLRGHCLWATRGNHDDPHSGSANDYGELFTLPTAGESGGLPSATEAWYSFDHGDVHFVCLDSESSSRDPAGPMLAWLAADLAANRRRWVIAYWHHPPYSKGSHDSDTDTRMTEMRENAMPILEAFGVDLVLTGHSHAYERSFLLDGHHGTSPTLQPSMILDGGDGDPAGDGEYHKPGSPGPRQGIVAVVTGGASSIEAGDLDHPAMVRSLGVLGSVVIDVDGLLLEATYLDDQGAVRDRFVIRKLAVIDSGPAATATLRLAVQSPVRRGPVDFRVTLPGPGRATLGLFDVTGRRLRLLSLETGWAGPQAVRWDGRDGAGRAAAPGVLFAVLEFAGTRRVERLVLVP